MTPGISTAPFGSLTSFQTRHSCSWRGLAISSTKAPARTLQDQIDDVARRHVGGVRTGPASPADVIADLLGRDAFGRAVDHAI